MTTDIPADQGTSAASWESVALPESARRHLEDLREARARGHWADELDSWRDLVASLRPEQRKALIPVLSQVCH